MHIVSIKKINIENIKYNKKNITYKKFRGFVLKKYFTCIYNGKKTIFTWKVDLEKEIIKIKKYQVILLSHTDFDQLLLNLYQDFIKYFSQNTRKHTKTVKQINFKKVKRIFVLFLIIFPVLLVVPYVNTVIKISVILYYITCLSLKSIFLIYSAIKRDDFEHFDKYKNMNFKQLPKYTILVPMFKENKKTIEQLIKAISNIEYQQNLLDVKLVLEEDDIGTHKIIQTIRLPEYITSIFVPYFEPRTKPKALNVASLFALGEYLVVYDAEDIPERQQLLKSVYEFNLNKEVQILQCCLHFYNYRKNFLTQCFNIEYSVWFKNVLKTLSDFNITLPLGGTSNHIRFAYLEKVNFWDSYNVTEDLELSVITNKNDVKICHLNSDTREWCVVNFSGFIKQRTRWLKGYLLTYFTHFNDFLSVKHINNAFFFHVVVGFNALCFLCMPLVFFIACYQYYKYKYLICYYLISNLVYYVQYIFIYTSLIRNIDVLLIRKTIIAFFLYPFYFILHIFASWKAFFEIFYKPFYWSKTSHLTN